MVWPTLGSRTAKDQIRSDRTVQTYAHSPGADIRDVHNSRAQGLIIRRGLSALNGKMEVIVNNE